MKNRIKELRKEKDMTQTTLADICGIDECTLSRMEHNKKVPFLKNALKISLALNERVEDVFVEDVFVKDKK